MSNFNLKGDSQYAVQCLQGKIKVDPPRVQLLDPRVWTHGLGLPKYGSKKIGPNPTQIRKIEPIHTLNPNPLFSGSKSQVSHFLAFAFETK